LGLAPDDIAVGIVGRVAPEKGHRDLLEALRLLADRHPCLRVVVVGNGPDVPALRREVSEKGLGARVVFAGFREDVNNVIAALDVVAVPSVWPEPCSAVIQQGMALGKPVVATRMGGTPEMVADGENGLLVSASDPAALADALGRLADSPELRRDLGDAGRTRVEAHFTLSRMTDEVESLYRRMMGKAAR
jgi:glycosyltransferase involved in cell wall biosynthesis